MVWFNVLLSAAGIGIVVIGVIALAISIMSNRDG